MITINGISYEAREQPNKSKSLSKLLMMAAEMGAMNYGYQYIRERPHVNLEEEFELIQNKQSKLSRNDREWVVRMFNRKYKIADNQ
jgi:hypothetical protein